MKFSTITGLLLSILLLTSLVSEASSNSETTEPSKNSEFNSDQLSADQWAKNAANTTNFIENKGQVLDMEGQSASYVDYLLDRGSTQIFLLDEIGIAWQFKQVHYPDGYDELLANRGGEEDNFHEKLKRLSEQVRTETFRMDMLLEGANPDANVSTLGKSADYFNYYDKNTLGVHHFEQVTYHDVYPGIDWVVYTNENGLKYDFVIHPGADPNQIKLKFSHHEELCLDDEGNLIHGNRMGSFTEFAPVSFQRGQEVPTEFLLQDDILQFELGEYNTNEILTIDPARVWGTYYGAVGEITSGNDCYTDDSGNVFLAGTTNQSTNIASGGHQVVFGGGVNDAMLVKFNASGVRQWATYYGGSATDSGNSCATDASGNVYLAGTTSSSNNIAFMGAQNLGGGGSEAYLVKFNSAGFREWGTYFGGESGDIGLSCATDAFGSVYIAGATTSLTGIASGGHQTTFGGDRDAFLAKYSSAGTFLWSTYYGGLEAEAFWVCGTSTHTDGSVYLTADTESTNDISDSGFQNSYAGGGGDAFLVKFNAAGVRQWATYYGGSGFDHGNSCTTDPSGNVYLAGETESSSGISFGGHQNSPGGSSRDAFLVKFNASGVRQWGTYYGGLSTELRGGCSTDNDGNVFLSGKTQSLNNIADGGHQNSFGGGAGDGFLVKFSNAGVRLWGTYYGGSGDDNVTECATDAAGDVFIAGFTSSINNIAQDGHQNVFNGGIDAFLAKFEGDSTTTTPCIHSTLNGTVAAAASSTWPVIIHPCTHAGDYNTITDVVSGQTYQFVSSEGSDWLVLTDESNNLLVEGTSPISWTASYSGTVRLHVSVNSDCDTESVCRLTTVSCISCPTPQGCIHSTAVGSVSAPTDGDSLQIASCVFAGQYSIITDIVSGETYVFVSSVSSDWLVLTDDANNILIEGFPPLSWTASFSGTVRLHISTNPNCGIEAECRTTSVQCTSCISTPETCCDIPQPGAGCPQYPDCEIAVCASDPYCCNTEWDFACASSAMTLCGFSECIPSTCTSPTLTTQTATDCPNGKYDVLLEIGGDGNGVFYDVYVSLPACDEAQPYAGFSDDPVCETAVCAIDAFCCDDAWDAVCAYYASTESACSGCLAPHFAFIGTFAGGTTGISIGTFPIDEDAEISVFHDWDPSCDQVITVGPDEACGCTDESAVNYDPDAEIEDGSCVYALANNDCSNAEPLQVVGWPETNTTQGSLTGAFGSGWGACVGVDGPDVFFTFNASTVNHYIINLNAFGGFAGVVELYDVCSGTLLDCFAPAPDCGQAQGSPGFPANSTCEAAVCNDDPFCCDTEWDSICADAAANDFINDCAGCLGGTPITTAIALDLSAGDYILRVRNLDGQTILDGTGNFLIGVQSFPIAKVQDNPNSILYACNQGGFQLEDFVGATPQNVTGVLDYEWLIAEQGGNFQNSWQRGGPNYSTRLDWLGMDYGTTYNVYVRLLLNVPGLGPVWGVYQGDYLNPNIPGASACTIGTSANVTPTELRPNYTPTNASGDNYSLCDFAIAYNVSGSQNFRWRFDPDVDPNNDNEIIYTRGSGIPSVRLNWVNGLTPGLTYNVAVEVQVSGQWSGYNTVLPLTLALPPNDVVVRSQFCGGTYASNGYILSQSVCDADLYQFRFTPVGGGTPSYRNSGNYVCFMSAANPALTPGDYDVQVKVTQSGVPGDWGPVCTITISGPQGQGNETPVLRDIASTSTASLFPNPNAGNEVRVNLDGMSEGNHEVMIAVYDVYGKQVRTEGFGHEGESLSRLIRFDNDLAMGMYMVQIIIDGENFTNERLVVK